ncbi:MAG TPA: hypothetical protein VH350_17905 [Candidatus Sulfotelmatobacter sp.]|nr:hypothetical protein [Candidatus Sulfotelmatobacter sp.]
MKRTKSLLRDIIAAQAQVHWVAQISANLLRDEELVDLIAASCGKWIFIGMESIDPTNLKDVNKGFNKPGEYACSDSLGRGKLPQVETSRARILFRGSPRACRSPGPVPPRSHSRCVGRPAFIDSSGRGISLK